MNNNATSGAMSGHSAMGAMAMGGHATTAKMAMGGMSMTVSHGTTNILPNWLAVIWTLVFFWILVVHVRHVADTHGERRGWHSGHVAMAAGMLFMYAPASLDHFGIPSGFWQLVFVNASGAVLLWMLAQALLGRPVSLLWLLLAIDLAAMVYMWSPTGFVAPITWVLVAYFAILSILWVTNRMRDLDGRVVIGGRGAVNPDGTITAHGVAHLVCERDLRTSMFLMTLGMAYMFAAMQLLM